MDKPNVFRTNGFYLAAGDTVNVAFKDLFGDDVAVELRNGSDALEDWDSIGFITQDDTPNLITSWASDDAGASYDTFTSTDNQITSAITDGSAVAKAHTNTFSVTKGKPLYLTFGIIDASGLPPTSVYLRSGTAISNVLAATGGANAMTLTPTSDSASAQLVFENTAAAAEWFNDIGAEMRPYLDNGEITLTATTTGIHYIEFGAEAGAAVAMDIRLYIHRTGKRLCDWMQSLGLGYITFLGTELWSHDSDNVPRCNIYGEQKEFIVGVVFNEAAGEIKLLDSLEIHTDGQWEVESIEIPATLNYPNGMYSRIPQGKFKNREGVLCAEFLRNMKTSSSAISAIQALKGEALRGDSAYMVLKNTSTGKVSLFKVRINATTSR